MMLKNKNVSRPAQGQNSTKPGTKSRPAYKPVVVPRVVSSGSVSRPKDTRWSLMGRRNTDATPKVVQGPS